MATTGQRAQAIAAVQIDRRHRLVQVQHVEPLALEHLLHARDRARAEHDVRQRAVGGDDHRAPDRDHVRRRLAVPPVPRMQHAREAPGRVVADHGARLDPVALQRGRLQLGVLGDGAPVGPGVRDDDADLHRAAILTGAEPGSGGARPGHGGARSCRRRCGDHRAGGPSAPPPAANARRSPAGARGCGCARSRRPRRGAGRSPASPALRPAAAAPPAGAASGRRAPSACEPLVCASGIPIPKTPTTSPRSRTGAEVIRSVSRSPARSSTVMSKIVVVLPTILRAKFVRASCRCSGATLSTNGRPRRSPKSST